MKTAPSELISALLNYANVKFAELYTFTLLNGNIYQYTSLDVNVGPFVSGELLITRNSMRQTIGLDVDSLDLTVTPITANIAGVGWLAALRNGSFDGTTVKLERTFFKVWDIDSILGTVTFFLGFVSDIDPLGRASAGLRVKSMVEQLAVQWPRMTYESQCVWHLYNAGCGLERGGFTSNGTVLAGGNARSFPTSMNQANNYFDLGVIRFTSGNNIDAMRSISSYSGGNVSVAFPLFNTPTANDSFTIYPGCEKTMSVCSNKFSNLSKFRGFPFIPSPETAY